MDTGKLHIISEYEGIPGTTVLHVPYPSKGPLCCPVLKNKGGGKVMDLVCNLDTKIQDNVNMAELSTASTIMAPVVSKGKTQEVCT